MIERKLINRTSRDSKVEVCEHFVKIEDGNKTIFISKEDWDRRQAAKTNQIGLSFKFAEYVDCSGITSSGVDEVVRVVRDEKRRVRW